MLYVQNVKEVTIIPLADGSSVLKLDPPQGTWPNQPFDTVVLDRDGKVVKVCDSRKDDDAAKSVHSMLSGVQSVDTPPTQE